MCDCSLGISGWEQGGEVLDGVIGDAALVGRLDEHLIYTNQFLIYTNQFLQAW